MTRKLIQLFFTTQFISNLLHMMLMRELHGGSASFGPDLIPIFFFVWGLGVDVDILHFLGLNKGIFMDISHLSDVRQCGD